MTDEELRAELQAARAPADMSDEELMSSLRTPGSVDLSPIKPLEPLQAPQAAAGAGLWDRLTTKEAPNLTLSDLVVGNSRQPASQSAWNLLEAPGAGLAKGLMALPQSIGYLLPKAGEAVTGLGGLAENPVSRFFGQAADSMSGGNKAINESFQQAHGDSKMATGGQILGNIIGASTGPAVSLANKSQAAWRAGGFVNKLRSVGQSGALGAGQAVTLGTQTDDDSALKNAAIGGGAGMLGQVVAGKIGDVVTNRMAAQANPANILRDRAATAAHEAGYTIPPSQTNPTLTNRILEGTAGKITTAQRASRQNEQVTNNLVAKALGTTPDNLTPEGLEAIRLQAGKAYGDLANVGTFTPDQQFHSQIRALGLPEQAIEDAAEGMGNPQVQALVESLTAQQGPRDARALVDILKRLRDHGRGNFNAIGDPVKKDLGGVQKKAAAALEEAIDRELAASGRSDLLEAFRNSRRLIAKSHTVEKSLGATGTVSAPKLADQLRRGVPLTDELRMVAETARAFPKAVQSLGNQSVLPISPLDFAFGSGMAGVGFGTGNPALAALAAVRPVVRAGILSGPYQRAMGAPSYGSSALLKALGTGSGASLLPLTSAPLLSGAQ